VAYLYILNQNKAGYFLISKDFQMNMELFFISLLFSIVIP